MAEEIERKFLVKDDSWKRFAQGVAYKQGYMSAEHTIRVRTAGENAYLTIKGPTTGLTRPEFEYEIPHSDALEMMEQLCRKPLVEKTRYIIESGSHKWEIDVFEGDNEGLIIAEIELLYENEPFEKPEWLGEEVSHDIRYRNSSLIDNPYCNW